MRLNLYWRGRDVIDVEAHVWRRRAAPAEEDGPSIQAAPHLAASELAEDVDTPTYVHAFGFAPSRSVIGDPR